MCPWESQPLPGILEDLPPLPLSLPPYTRLFNVTDLLKELEAVYIPDFLEHGNPNGTELSTMFTILDTWEMLIVLMRWQLIKKATIDA